MKKTEFQKFKQDVMRNVGSYGIVSILKTFLINRAFRVICTYRLARYLQKNKFTRLYLLPIARLFHFITQGSIGFELPLQVEAGGGFCVYHGWGLIINNKVQLGENVTLLHHCTIGENAHGIPLIGNNVSIGTGVIIIGKVVIGNNVTIGAGTVVTKDIQDNMVVVGNPQKVIREKIALSEIL